MLNHKRGFTLLEVMVALAVLAIALAGVMKAVSSHTANAAYLQEKTLAHWVAMNKINEFIVTEKWPSPGSKDSGKALMGGHEWVWRVETKKEKFQGIFEIGVATVEVRFDERDESPRASLLTAYPVGQ